jgi:DNA topoisomerase III
MAVVVYAEKPSLGRKIAEALGASTRKNGFICGTTTAGEELTVTWGFGHMGGLVYPEVYNPLYKNWRSRPCPFIPDHYQIAPIPDRGAEDQLAIVSDFFKPENTVICATDDDREGELIFAYVCDLVGYQDSFQRVRIDSLTINGIRKAFSDLIDGSTRKNIADAGRARAIADWTVGINLTTASTIHFMKGKSKTMSVGRVQTPALAMIVERELAIRDFISRALFTPTAIVTTPTGESYIAKSTCASLEDEKQARAILARVTGARLRVEKLESIQKKTPPPLLHSQTSLQMEANRKLAFTAQQTLDCSQELYEKGLITYPRTSSQHLTSDMAPALHKILDILGKTNHYGHYVKAARIENFPSSTCDDSKVESHFAIVPTGKIPQQTSAPALELYHLIALSLIRLYYPPSLVEETTVTHVAVATTESAAVQAGVLRPDAIVKDEAGTPDTFVAKGSIIREKGWWAVDAMPKRDKEMLPILNEGDVNDALFEVKKTETKPPKRYTDETLVGAMKSAGRSLEDEDLREILSNPRHMGIGTDATRAGIIETLVARGFIERKKKQIYATPFGIQVITTLPLEDLKSASLTANWEQRLKAIENGTDTLDEFVRDIEAVTRDWCDAIKKSDRIIVTLATPDPELEGAVCPLCGSPLHFTTAGVGCGAYPITKCRYTIWGTIAHKELTRKQLGLLVVKGETPVYRGFVNKKDEKFEAALVLDRPSGRIRFKFPATPEKTGETQR